MPDEVVIPLRRTLWLSASLLVVGLGVLLVGGWSPVGAPFAPLLLWTLPMGSAVSLLLGFRAGNAAFVVCVLGIVAYSRAAPAQGVQETTARFALVLSLVCLQVLVWSFQSTFRAVRRTLAEQERAIRLRLAEHARLLRTLVDNVQARLEGMVTHFQPGELTDLAGLRTKQAELVSALQGSQHALLPDERSGLVSPTLDFRNRVLQWMIGITWTALAVMLTRRALGTPGPVAPGIALITICSVLFALLTYRPAWRSWIALGFTLSCQAALAAASAFWAFHGPPPALVFLVTIAYQAVLIELRYSAVLVAVLNLAVVGFAFTQQDQSTPGADLFMLAVAASALFTQGYWHLMAAWVSSSLQASKARGLELARVERFRTRICGTLFHDVANLVHSMRMLSSLDDQLPEDAHTFQALHGRLVKLVAAAAQTVTDDSSGSAQQLSRVPLEGVFSDARDLFAFRLREKEQSLECVLPEALSVTAQPDLLRDSVLANLISNAIKFSPPGATIRLCAERTEDSVEISVRDSGPGWPEGLAESLAQGAKVFSTPGTAGEQGLGMGLTLTREHLLRMGGDIALRHPAEGGSEAVIALQSAD